MSAQADSTSVKETKILKILAVQQGVAQEKITREMGLYSDPLNVDSIDAVEIVMELEDEFDISIPDDRMDNAKTVGQLIDLVKEFDGMSGAATKTIDDFLQMDIVRSGDIAEVIFDKDEKGRPVRLIGFTADANLTDYEILELAHEYYQDIHEANSGAD